MLKRPAAGSTEDAASEIGSVGRPANRIGTADRHLATVKYGDTELRFRQRHGQRSVLSEIPLFGGMHVNHKPHRHRVRSLGNPCATTT